MFTITLSIIVLTCLISATAFNNSKIIDDLIFWPPAISIRHQYYRFITCGLIHADIMLIAANIPTYIKRRDDYNYRSLGASGAVCAVLFAFILLKPWAMLQVIIIPIPAIIYAFLFLGYSVYMSKRGGDNVNHDAHFWGALFGILFTIAVRPSVMTTFINELSHPRFNF